jgi:hypothetical protein
MGIKQIKKTVGETLVEALVAIFVLTIVGMVASSMIVSAIRTMRLNEDYLIAQSLTVEAVEAIKNIRDTNWLRYPTDKEKCWLSSDPLSGCANSIGSDSSYALNYRNYWQAERIGSVDAVDYLLDLSDPNGANNNDFDLCASDHFQYKQCNTVADAKFYREITVQDANESRIRLKVRIQWLIGRQLNTMETLAIITNHL